MNAAARYVFGPVPSRRLGQSLGVDVIPRKLCTLNCIYCELGTTAHTTLKRAEYVSSTQVVAEIRSAITAGGIDHITFSGSGEPTLNSSLGAMIHDVKRLTDIPVAVITNGTLMFLEEVRNDLLAADVVLPSLDAATRAGFAAVNRPHQDLRLGTILRGMQQFRASYKGQIWMEIFLTRGVNDSEEELEMLRLVLERIRPDRIQLNTVVRPPAESSAQRVELHRLIQIKAFFGDSCEIIAAHTGSMLAPGRTVDPAVLVGMVARRPMTAEEIAAGTGMPSAEICRHLNSLEAGHRITSFMFDGKRYYRTEEIVPGRA